MSDAPLTATIQGRDVNLRALLQELRRELQATDTTATRAGRGMGATLAQGTVRGEAGVLRLQTALARNQAQAGDTEGAILRLRTALQGLSTATPQSLAAEGALARLERQAQRTAVEVPKTGSALQGLVAAAGPLAAAFSTQQLVAYGQEAIALANRTRDATSALRALAGEPRLFAEALAVARQQQILFGGSLEENISGIQGLITVARSSGAELAQLVDLSQRLSVKDPAQGIGGARIALNEALAGDPTSLARRYEIPKAALAALRDESTTTQQKIAILDQYLNQIGITSATVAGSISQETQAFNALGAAAEQVQIKVGTMLSQGLTPAAQGATALMQAFTDGQQANATLTALIGTLQQLTGASQASVQSGSALTSQLLSFLGVLTPAQQQIQAYNQAHAETGQAVAIVASVYQGLLGNMPAVASAFGNLVPRLQAVAAESDANAATVQALALGLEQGTISLDQVTQALAQLEQAHAVSAQAAADQATQELLLAGGQDQLSAATQAAVEQLNQEESAKAANTAQSEAMAQIQTTLANLGSAVASGLFTSAEAADYLAQRYGVATGAAYALVAAQAAVIAGERRLAQQAKDTVNLVPGGVGFDAPGRRGSGDADIERVVALQQEVKAQTELNRVRGAAPPDSPPTRSGGARASRTGAARQEQSQLLAGQQRYQRASEDAERQHQETLADIAADGAKKRQEAETQLHRTRLRGRAEFYRSLADLDQAQAQQLSAAYERIEQETQQIAQSQGADAAAAYRDAALEAARGQADIQQEIQDAREAGDLGKVEYLEGVAKLQAEADRQELERIKNQGSAIAAESERRYAEEEARYRAHLDRMAQDYQDRFGVAPSGSAPVPAAPTTSPASTPASRADSTSPALVSDPATQDALTVNLGRIEQRIGGLVAEIQEVARRVSGVEGAVRAGNRAGMGA